MPETAKIEEAEKTADEGNQPTADEAKKAESDEVKAKEEKPKADGDTTEKR